jgi:hypothetical protein
LIDQRLQLFSLILYCSLAQKRLVHHRERAVKMAATLQYRRVGWFVGVLRAKKPLP